MKGARLASLSKCTYGGQEIYFWMQANELFGISYSIYSFRYDIDGWNGIHRTACEERVAHTQVWKYLLSEEEQLE